MRTGLACHLTQPACHGCAQTLLFRLKVCCSIHLCLPLTPSRCFRFSIILIYYSNAFYMIFCALHGYLDDGPASLASPSAAASSPSTLASKSAQPTASSSSSSSSAVPACAQCRGPIHGISASAGTLIFHPECLVCSKCKQPLQVRDRASRFCRRPPEMALFTCTFAYTNGAAYSSFHPHPIVCFCVFVIRHLFTFSCSLSAANCDRIIRAASSPSPSSTKGGAKTVFLQRALAARSMSWMNLVCLIKKGNYPFVL